MLVRYMKVALLAQQARRARRRPQRRLVSFRHETEAVPLPELYSSKLMEQDLKVKLSTPPKHYNNYKLFL